MELNKGEITVEVLKKLLDKCPDDAYVRTSEYESIEAVKKVIDLETDQMIIMIR